MTVQDEAAPAASAAPAPQPAPRSGKAALMTWLRRALLVLVLAAAGWALYSHWGGVSKTLVTVPWHSTVLSQLAVVLGIACGTLGWQTIVDGLGKPIGAFRGAQIMLVGSLGKYVPGSVWAYLLQMELGRQAGLPRARVFTATLINLGVGVVASLLLGVLALPVMMSSTPGLVWLYLLLPIGLIALHPKVLTWGASLVLRVLKKAPLDHVLPWSTVGRSLGYALLSYVLFGVHLWLLSISSGPVSVRVLLLCAGAVAIGMTVGLIAFILPSGAGVRELVLVSALSTTMPVEQAIAFTLVSRLMFTVADIAMAGAAAGLARWQLAKSKPVDA
ncbi:flippase-like domain-containing protein [Allokutzneria sp. A3M-2-11 16]|uniref:lysylphosphatidylglycerol synthase domain-containing protein n=1 Tax=Allokutzneria sp. A3M-2-11 16 TaxID=2962043 RepID=UPI0020B80C70|nr:lysylphosphatidylglycerol synthase domain-containing protein [Allokutzneria sp. A3M-2-11 16]MCP3799662.1 flippase-like domain-containing protein [Allokutzneria sp. A3M-2-11 16]